MRVLIAEDDAVSRTILRRSVEKLGHECLAAENGQAALELYRNTPGVDLVISDWMMPGIEVLQARSRRYGHSYAVALCDVDLFKEYNDRYGHPAGDRVLRSVAGAIVGNRRGGDTAYRYGGEEFLIVLPEQTLKAAASTADHLRETVEGLRIPHEANVPMRMVTISAGVALQRGDSKSAGELLEQADAALYKAKEAGRNRVAI